MSKNHTETLAGGTPVFTSAAHAITTDSMLLANFCTVHPRFSACDLGSGCGILLLALVDKGLAGRAVGVEQSEEGATLLQRAAEKGGLANVSSVHGNLKTFTSPTPFDVVVSNPPYFSAGRAAPAPLRAAARHEGSCTIFDVAAAAGRLLKDGGRFYTCFVPNRMEALFAALRENALAPKQLCFVRKGAESPPWLLLLDARKNGGEGLEVLPDILLPPGKTVQY